MLDVCCIITSSEEQLAVIKTGNECQLHNTPNDAERDLRSCVQQMTGQSKEEPRTGSQQQCQDQAHQPRRSSEIHQTQKYQNRCEGQQQPSSAA